MLPLPGRGYDKLGGYIKPAEDGTCRPAPPLGPPRLRYCKGYIRVVTKRVHFLITKSSYPSEHGEPHTHRPDTSMVYGVSLL